MSSLVSRRRWEARRSADPARAHDRRRPALRAPRRPRGCRDAVALPRARSGRRARRPRSCPGPLEQRQRAVAVAAAEQDPRQRHRGVCASRARARPLRAATASSPSAISCSAAEGQSESRKRSTLCAGLRADELGDDLAVRNALTAGMLWIRKCRARFGLASVSSLASSTCPSRAATACSSTGPSCRQGPHHSAQKSTTTGTVAERSITAVWKVASVTSISSFMVAGRRLQRCARQRHVSARSPAMASSSSVEDDGEGPPVVLLHGLTATRRYVVMGSRSLERPGTA